jgi:hypothetical protein
VGFAREQFQSSSVIVLTVAYLQGMSGTKVAIGGKHFVKLIWLVAL